MLDFIKLAQKYHIPYATSGVPHARPNWVQCQCPACGSGGTHGGWYLGFSLIKGNFHCYRCGSMRVWETIAAMCRCSVADAGVLVREHQVGGAQPRTAPVVRAKAVDPPPGMAPMLPQHRTYLRGRGFDPEELEKDWGLQGCGHLSDLWSWRVVVPIHDETGNVVAYQGRSISDSNTKKYRMTEDRLITVDPKGLVYGLHQVPGDTVLVVEGCPGVWRLGAGAVGTFGIDWKRQQINKLRKFKNLYILFDPEPKAQQRAVELAGALAIYGNHVEVLSGFNTDPGEFSQEQVVRLRRKLGLRSCTYSP